MKKKLLKSDSICQSYVQIKKGPCFFDSQCILLLSVNDDDDIKVMETRQTNAQPDICQSVNNGTLMSSNTSLQVQFPPPTK